MPPHPFLLSVFLLLASGAAGGRGFGLSELCSGLYFGASGAAGGHDIWPVLAAPGAGLLSGQLIVLADWEDLWMPSSGEE